MQTQRLANPARILAGRSGSHAHLLRWRLLAALWLPGAPLAGCGDPPPTRISCPMGQMTGTAKWGPLLRPIDKDLVITGTAQHSQDLAIQRIWVGGLPATNIGFNFSAWSVTLPSSHLASLANEKNEVLVHVAGQDACGTKQDLTQDGTSQRLLATFQFAARVQPTELSVTLPKAQTFMPADGQTATEVRVSANPEAVGATVSLSAVGVAGSNQGRFLGVGTSNALTLTSDGQNHAVATALYVSDAPGSVLLSAQSGDVRWPTVSILVAGPPLLLPKQATLKPGQNLRVTALSAGALQTCTQTTAAGVTVTQNAPDKTRIDIDLAVASTLTSAVQVQVTCSDPFGQTVAGAYDVAP